MAVTADGVAGSRVRAGQVAGSGRVAAGPGKAAGAGPARADAGVPVHALPGAALPMAADLAATPASGLRVQLCGDAHLSNFGAFASPERRLVFDINDFGETLPGPFEWDVKRLAASLAVAGRDNGFTARTRRKIVPAAAEGVPHRDARPHQAAAAGRLVCPPGHRAGLGELQAQVKAEKIRGCPGPATSPSPGRRGPHDSVVQPGQGPGPGRCPGAGPAAVRALPDRRRRPGVDSCRGPPEDVTALNRHTGATPWPAPLGSTLPDTRPEQAPARRGGCRRPRGRGSAPAPRCNAGADDDRRPGDPGARPS